MNRMEEYNELLEELEADTPDLVVSVQKAQRRKNRKRWFYGPMGSIAAVFALFVVLVNCSTTVAYACSQIPFIRDLAAAVTFSPSLSDAVDNEYVQPMDLVQEKNGITVKVEALIVDQKQVNIFYRLDSEEYEDLEADPDVLDESGERPASCSYGSSSFGLENGELRHLDVDFIREDVPGALRLVLKVYSNTPGEVPSAEANLWEVPEGPSYLAEFEFLLQFDPRFTEVGETIPVGRTLDLDGQKITFTDVEIYPSHMRVNIEGAPENTAWLKQLDFYILANGKKKFEPVSNGITATGTLDSGDFTSYRADSAYFHDAQKLELVVTGAEWLDKENSQVWLDLKTGQHDPLPFGTEFHSAEPCGNGWTVSFRHPYRDEKHTMYNLFSSVYRDAQGTEYYSSMSSNYFDRDDLNGDQPSNCFIEEFLLGDYPYNEVWLELVKNRSWTAEAPISIPIR